MSSRPWHETGPEAPSPEVSKLRAQLDAEALNQIASLLDGTEWDAGTGSEIAAIVRTTGRQVRDTTEPDDIACGRADEN